MRDDRLGALSATVREWIAADPDPKTRDEASTLLIRATAGDAQAEAQLHDAFDGRLRFGTGGLRAELGAGPRRMNRVVVAQSSAGLAAFLKNRVHADKAGDTLSVTVGYDARVNSKIFAYEAAAVLAGAGLRVALFSHPVPTPVAAFAVRHGGTTAGVMITASHNPRRDNGMKIYLGGVEGGSQIAPPLDVELAKYIEGGASLRFDELPRSDGFSTVGPEIVDAYVSATTDAVRAGLPQDCDSSPIAETMPRLSEFGDPLDLDPTPRVVYTAMHGVGADVARAVFGRLGLPEVIPVPEQDRPNGAFPTVEYPNPEDPGALDLAFALAQEVEAHFVLAHDPDADRLAFAARHPDEGSGYRRLTGNELGLLLGWRVADRAYRDLNATGQPISGTFANTIVSSPALGALARSFGFDHVETLPGFRWVSRVPELIYGYEEALGYLTTPQVVGDKDGISAAAEVLAFARELHAEGQTVWQKLDALSQQFGHFASSQVVIRREHLSTIEELSSWVREHPPAAFGERAVSEVRDFREAGLAPTPANILAYDLADGSRVMIRPSGTEPKLKVYLDAFCDVGSAAERRATTAVTLADIEVAVRGYLEGAQS